MSTHTSHSAPLVDIKELNYCYDGPNGQVTVLDQVSLTIQPKEFIAILGSSGSGKSSFLYLLGGLEQPTSGSISVGGKNLQQFSPQQLEIYRQSQVSFVFQFFNLLPTLTAEENVLLGMEAMDRPPADAKERARRVLASVGLADKSDRRPSQLSGGEQQRVAIARALAKRAPLILADEPTGNLDEETAASVLDLFLRIQQEYEAAVVLITHDPAIARRASRTLELRKGKFHDVRHGTGEKGGVRHATA